MKTKEQIKTEMILYMALELAGDNALTLQHYEQAEMILGLMGIK